MDIHISFIVWCDHDKNDSKEMTEVKSSKYEVTFECPDCKRQVTVNEVTAVV